MAQRTTGRRGCGVRQPGGVYMETLMGKRGKPLEHFLLDPPVPVDPGLGLGALGIVILERPDGSGIHDVYDHVGSSGYPNVADFIEETRRMGLSRRISRNAEFSKLGPGSRIFLAHSRAIHTHFEAEYEALVAEAINYPGAGKFACPCQEQVPQHDYFPSRTCTGSKVGEGREMCVGLYWENVEGGEDSYDPDLPPRTVTRKIGSTLYQARKPIDMDATRSYEEGFFLSLPLHRLAVINDPEGGEDEASFEKASGADLPVVREDA